MSPNLGGPYFFLFDPAPFTQFRHQGVRPAPQGVAGFEPRTSSIRRGRFIHSTMPHLARTMIPDCMKAILLELSY